MMSKIFTCAHLPPQLEQQWLQHLRDFDNTHPGCHFEVWVESPEVSMADAIKMLKVEPGLTFTKIFERAKSEPQK